ncbi:MAG TPA: hypothetical protein VHD32_06035 [Candidatus Didemnitutus sp.]|nr:hypothetical protein [Candidatus Didemnitutus sp.]
MRLAFVVNLWALGLSSLFAIVAAFFDPERVRAAIQHFPLFVIFFLPLFVCWLSAVYLFIQSWVMLIRFWYGREWSENLKLLFLLCFFSFLASYYFYWKRADIDPSAT